MEYQPAMRTGFDRFLGLIEDVLSTDHNRRKAEEIEALLPIATGCHTKKPQSGPATISGSLDRVSAMLKESLKTNWTRETTARTIHWGTEAGGAVASASTPGPSTFEFCSPSDRPYPLNVDFSSAIEPVPPPETSRNNSTAELTAYEGANSHVAEVAISLSDWLERADQDERINAKRALELARHKAEALLGALLIERIDRNGYFDERDQQVLDIVAADKAEMDMTISQTVQCGYRQGQTLIRPQQVLLFRYRSQ